MKLYYSPGACSLAVRITLNEATIDFTSIAVDLKTKQTEMSQDFLNITLKGTVPVLELDNAELLTENIAIQTYLADHYGLESLLPPLSDFRRYRILEWISFVASDLHKSFSPFFNPLVTAEIKEKIFLPLLRNKLTFVEQFLQKNIYLGGNTVSIADHYCFVVLRWLRAVKIDIETFPAIARYFNQMKIRPAVALSLEEENLLKVT